MSAAHGLSTETTIFGKRIGSPVGIASGPAPNLKWLSVFAELGYDVLTYKTMRDRSWKGHGMPNIVHVRGDFEHGFSSSETVTGAMTNSLGMPTPEPEKWEADARRMAASSKGRLFVVSVTATAVSGTSEAEMLGQFESLSRMAKRTGADAVELNLSCPNVMPGEGGETFTDPELSGRVVESVRNGVGSSFPILLKTGYLDDYRRFVEETFDDRLAYVAINSISAQVKGPSGELLFADRGGRAGVCGTAIRSRAKKAVAGLARMRNGPRDFKIVGLGGVLGPLDAIGLIDAGADAVESATGALLDPTLALRIKLGLLQEEMAGR